MHVVAVIPARGGSVGLPGKNIRNFNGIPLVGRAVLAARHAESVDTVYVSSDADAILAVAERFGAVGIRRPADISTSVASSESALIHALDDIRDRSGADPDIIVFLQCTSPFTTPDQVDAVVKALAASKAEAAFAAIEDHGFIWGVGDDGLARGITHDETKPRQRRQDMRPRYRESGAIYAMRVPAFRAIGNRFCGPTVLVPIDMPPVEIDTLADWAVAEAIASADDPVRALAAAPTIRALVTDFDGVHTDDGVVVFRDGSEAVVCNRSDGMGIELLRRRGLKLLILSREENPVVRARADKLRMPVQHDVRDKLPALDAWRQAEGLDWSEIAYVGNDINDLECLRAAGLSFCPADGHAEARAAADVVLSRTGGHGALREVAEYLLANGLVVS